MGVKLLVYQHDGEDIIIDSYRGKEWDDFVIMSFDEKTSLTSETYQQMVEVLSEIANKIQKQFIVLPPDLLDSIEIYGVKEDTEDEPVNA